MEKGVIAQQRGKRRHCTAAWKEKIWHSSVEKVAITQQCGKRIHGTIVIVQQSGKVVLAQQRLKRSHGETA